MELAASSATVIDWLFSGIKGRDERQSRAIPTGFKPLDEIIGGGVYPEELVVVGGYPGNGTTAFMIGMIRNLIDRKLPASEAPPVLVSLTEAMPELWMLRMLSIDSGLGEKQILDGVESEALEESRRRVAGYPLHFSRGAMQDVSHLEEQIDQIRKETTDSSRPGILLVDLIEDIYPYSPWESTLMGRKERIAEAVAELCNLASSSRWAVVAGTRFPLRPDRVVTEPPALRDIGKPDIIAQAASKVILLHRPEMYVTSGEAAKKRWTNLMQMIVARNVYGETGWCNMQFEHGKGRFEERKPE